jgi:hypothetical protein
LDGGDDFIDDFLFDGLAVSVLFVEEAGERIRVGWFGGEEKFEGVESGFEPAGGVETRSQLEGNFVAGNGAVQTSNLLQGDKAGALSGAEVIESGASEDSVFASKGDEISNSAQGDEIQKEAKVEILRFVPAERTATFEQGVSEFESEAGAAKVARLWIAAELWVDEREGGRGRGTDLVMIQNDDLYSSVPQVVDNFGGA